jgi:hypothetical protein
MNVEKENTTAENKIVVYQVLPVYLEIKIQIISPQFEENGVGKFNDFTEKLLMKSRFRGYYIWQSGVPHAFGGQNNMITSNDDPDVVKGSLTP